MFNVCVFFVQELAERKKQRHQRRHELSKRHSQASHERMRIIAELAQDKGEAMRSELMQIALVASQQAMLVERRCLYRVCVCWHVFSFLLFFGGNELWKVCTMDNTAWPIEGHLSEPFN